MGTSQRVRVSMAASTVLLFPVLAAAQAYPDGGYAPVASPDSASPWSLQVSGLVSHFKSPDCQNCQYRRSVPGIGLQRELLPSGRDAPLRLSLSGGLQSDSFGTSGGYVSGIASLAYRGAGFKVQPGLGAFAFYRYMGEGGDRLTQGRKIVPAILPVLSIEHLATGAGFNLLIAPNFDYGGRGRSGFVFLQFSYRFGRGGGTLLASGSQSDTEGRPH